MATDSMNSETRNTTYNLISVAYHCLQGVETCGRYLKDAEREGDQELANFFRDAQRMQNDCANRAKDFLQKQLPQS